MGNRRHVPKSCKDAIIALAADPNAQPKDIAIATGVSENCVRRTVHVGRRKGLTERVWGQKGPRRKIGDVERYVRISVLCALCLD